MSHDEGVTIEFKGRHDHITERMQEHATKKLQRLAHFEDALTRVEVVADHAHENPDVELIAHLRKGAPLVAKDRGESFSGTVDLLVDKMESQLRKWKEKLTNHKFPDAKEARARAAEGEGLAQTTGEETFEDALRKSLD